MLKSDVDSSRYFKMIHYNIIVVYCTLPVFCVVVVGGVVVGVALIASNRCSSCHPILPYAFYRHRTNKKQIKRCEALGTDYQKLDKLACNERSISFENSKDGKEETNKYPQPGGKG